MITDNTCGYCEEGAENVPEGNVRRTDNVSAPHSDGRCGIRGKMD